LFFSIISFLNFHTVGRCQHFVDISHPDMIAQFFVYCKTILFCCP